VGFVGTLEHCKQPINSECVFLKGKLSQYSSCRNNLAHEAVPCTSLACHQLGLLNFCLKKNQFCTKAETPLILRKKKTSNMYPTNLHRDQFVVSYKVLLIV